LQNPELTLHRLKEFYSRIYPVTLRRLREILRLDRRHRFKLQKTGVVVSGPVFGKNIPLDAVADGYRATFTWLCDLVAWAMLANRIDRRTGDIKGIVLIDEIEQHIHPSWQAELISYIRRVFPSLQIIATTHSPLVALSIGSEGLVVLKRRAGYVYAEDDAPDIRGYSVEDMLLDPKLFDTETYSPETNRLLERYRRLARLPKGKRTRQQNQRLEALVQKLQCVEPVITQDDNELAKALRKLRQKYDL
jgi:predicted ATP-binding protein involved in virulence